MQDHFRQITQRRDEWDGFFHQNFDGNWLKNEIGRKTIGLIGHMTSGEFSLCLELLFRQMQMQQERKYDVGKSAILNNLLALRGLGH